MKRTITITDNRTGLRTTFTAQKCRGAVNLTFLSVMVGTDNETDFAYIGFIRDGIFSYGGAKAKLPAADQRVLYVRAYYRALANRAFPDHIEILNSGKCMCCARKLTVPESIKTGYGPVCMTRVIPDTTKPMK